MTPSARLSAAIEILDRVLGGAAVEPALTNWGRGARYAGSSDRAEVRNIVFQCLRCRASYAALGGGLTGRGLALGFVRAEAPDQMSVLFGQGPHAALPPDPVTEAGRVPVGAEVHDIPDWLEAPLRQSLGADFDAVMQAMRHRAPVYLRVNPAKAGIADVIGRLADEGIEARLCKQAPFALEVTGGERKISASKAFAAGVVELQDLSSQAIVAALPLKDGMRVLDHCAGGGGKSLAMAAEVRLALFAHDIAPRRMADLPARAERAGVKLTLTATPESAGPFDLVLVDAPCSGSGSWRRDPEGKWKLDAARLAELTRIQAEILDRAAKMVVPGGWLAYATCSFLTVENMEQAQAFLGRTPGWSLETQLSLSPKSHSDGFFLALMQRLPS